MIQRMIIFIALFFISLPSFAELDFPKCIASPHGNYLLSAFYFDGNVILHSATLNHYTAAAKHLDAFLYSTSYLGIIKDNGDFKLAKISQQNLITIHHWMSENKIHAKLMLSLGHWSPDKMREVITKPDKQQHFINTLITILKDPQYHIGGIDVDWENFFSPRSDEVEKFPAFIKALRTALNENDLTDLCLSVDLPVEPRFAKAYPTPKEWAPYVDWANLMAYEFYGGNPFYTELDGVLGNVTIPYPDPNQAPDDSPISIASTLSIYTDREIPKRKLAIAWPLYGEMNYISSADEANHYGLREEIIDNRPTRTDSYASIYHQYGIYGKAKRGTTIHQYTFEQPDSVKGKHAYWITHLLLESPTAGHFYAFISYPDPKATQEAAQFVKEQGYLGFSAWQIAFDLPFENHEALLRVLYRELHANHH